MCHARTACATLFVFLLAGSASPVQARAQDPAGEKTHDAVPVDLGPVLSKVREKFRVPGLAAAAVRDGRIVAIGADGVRGLGSDEPVAVGDVSMIGSCGKSVTRFLIGRLVDKGLLQWDSTLAELLPDMKMRDEYRSVTVGDIIGHRGGMQPYTEVGPKRTPILFEQAGSAREQRAAFVAHLLSESPAAPPKTRFVYSNAGYGLLGHIAERLADKTYERLVRDEVFRPLGMNTATVGFPRNAGNVRGWIGHRRIPDGFAPVHQPGEPLAAIAPAGLMSCSIDDFARLAAALTTIEAGKPSEFLSAKTAARLPELRPGDSGQGEIFFGGDGRYTAAFALWPAHGFGVVVESNAGDSDDVCGAAINAVREAVAPSIAGRTPPSVGGQRPRYGLQIQADEDGGWTVGDVLPDSPAAAAGVKPGDRILVINDQAISGLNPDERMALMRHSPVKLKLERSGETVEITMRLP